MNRKGGPRTGGRVAGKPNRMSAARVEKALQEGKRLPPEDLLLVAEKSMAMVAHYEPGTPDKPNPFENEQRYAYWLAQAREALKAAAPYYAPKLHAIAYAPMVPSDQKVAVRDPREVMLEELMEMQRRGELVRQINPMRESVVIDAAPQNEEPKPPEPDDADGVAV